MIVHAFRTSMKWAYEINQVDMRPYSALLIHDAFKSAISDTFKNGTSGLTHFEGWFICFEPEHPHSHPIAIHAYFKNGVGIVDE